MLRTKSCPRCIGDLLLENTIDGCGWMCIQCGHRRAALRVVEPLSWQAGPPSRRNFSPAERTVSAGSYELRFDQASDSDLGYSTHRLKTA